MVCFVIRSYGRNGNASGQVHSVGYGSLEGRIGGEGRGRDPIYEKGVWGQGRTESFVQINFGGDVLLGGIRQLVLVCGIVVNSIALEGHYGGGFIAIYRRYENASFPR